MSTTTLLDAIYIVKENERLASKSYAEAAKKISNPIGYELFCQLSDFEKYHFKQLIKLEKSLLETGNFIDYEGKVFPLPPRFEIKAAKEPDQKSVMGIITEALELEKEAEKAYANLAAQLNDNSQGYRMFLRFSEEEHNHYRILMEAYWTLNDLGIWKWKRV